MHELSVMTALLATVEAEARKAGAREVVAINLVVGERTSFIDDSLLFYFEALASGTCAAGARLNIRRTPMRFYCAACASTYQPGGGHFRCPSCGVAGQLTSDGGEFLIESMEIET